MSKQFEKVDCRFGAPMGRPEIYNDFSGVARCFRVKMVDGDYDDGGAYWGGNSSIYCATDDNGDKGFRMFNREPNRKAAMKEFQTRASSICGNKKNNTIHWNKRF